MSDFWDTFTDGADDTLETLGEKVIIAGQEFQAVVHDVAVNPIAVPGGLSEGVTHVLHMNLADGEAIRDGNKIEARGMKGAVITKAHIGGGWLIQCGPANRWDGALE